MGLKSIVRNDIMSRISRRSPILAGVCLVLGLTWAEPSQAQEASPVPDTGQAQGVVQDSLQRDLGPEGPIEPSQVPRRSELDTFRREAIRDSLNLRVGTDIPGLLERIRSDVELVSEYETSEHLAGMGVRDLNAVHDQWQRITEETQAASESLTGALDRIEGWSQELEVMGRRWDRTLAQIDSTDLYLQVVGQIEVNVLETSQLEESLERIEGDLLSFATAILAIETRARNATSTAGRALERVRVTLWRPVAGPLWRESFAELDPGNALTRIGRQVLQRLELVWMAASRAMGVIVTHLLLILLLAAFIRWIASFVPEGVAIFVPARRDTGDEEQPEEREAEEEADEGQGAQEADERPEDRGASAAPAGGGDVEQLGDRLAALAATRIMGDRALSAGFLLSLLFVPALYSSLPTPIRDFMLLLSTIPAARVVLRVPEGRIRAGGLSIIVLFSASVVLALTLPFGLAKRLLTVVVALAGARVCRRIQRWLEGRDSHRWIERGFLGAMKLMQVLLVGGALLEVLGFAALAELVAEGLVTSIYLALLLRVLALAIFGILEVLPLTSLSEKLLSLRTHGQVMAERAAQVVGFFLAVIWLWSTLRLLDLDFLVEGIFQEVGSVGFGIGDLRFTVGDLVAFLITLWLAVLFARMVRFFFLEDLVPRAKFPKGVPGAIATLGTYAIVSIGFLVALAAANIDLTRIAILLSALGVGIGFGLQGVAANFVAGLILLFERPINAGDTVELDNLLGTVQSVGIRASVIRTFDGAEVIVPNGDLTSSRVINWTLSDRQRRMEVKVGVKYGTDPQLVMKVLSEAVARHPEVLRHPEPQVLFREFGDSSLNFALRFWVADHERFVIIWSEVTVLVNQALKKAEIEIPFPQRDLHLRSVDPPAGANLRGDSPARLGAPVPGGAQVQLPTPPEDS